MPLPTGRKPAPKLGREPDLHGRNRFYVGDGPPIRTAQVVDHAPNPGEHPPLNRGYFTSRTRAGLIDPDLIHPGRPGIDMLDGVIEASGQIPKNLRLVLVASDPVRQLNDTLA